ncbi:glycosyltransferase [Candidatus Margulisiibacteriota bacterium]
MLSVCMIVKNEARNLEQTLPQLVKHAEVIVVDTGSTDETVKVARELGARIASFAWINDFAAARNYSLTLATQPWIAWLDADEYVKEEDVKELVDQLKAAPENVSAHQLVLTESPYGKTERGISYARVKIFRNHQGIHFDRPINEQVVDKQGQLVAGDVLPIVLYHWGKHLDDARMEEKKQRYHKLYQSFLDKSPSDPYVNFLLGDLLRSEKRPEEACRAYTITIDNAGNDKKIRTDAIIRKAEVELAMGKHKDAFLTAKQVVDSDPDNMGARNIVATLLVGVGQADMAVKILEEVLKPLDHQAIDPIRELVVPRIILARACTEIKDIEKARLFESQARELKEKVNGCSK